MTAPIPRVGGRVLMIDPEDRLLLIHERIGDGTTHWLTPGGGVEAGEDPAVAAQREAYEEVGASIEIADRTAVLVTRRLWTWQADTYDQTDHFYVVRVPAGLQPRPRGLTAMEQQTVLGFGWWTVAQLRASDEVLVPADLGDVLHRVLRGSASGA